MSTGLYNGYPGGKKPISVIFKEKLKTGLMGGIMGVGLGSGMGVMHTAMMRPPPGERIKLLKANCGRTAAFMGVLFGVGSAFRN